MKTRVINLHVAAVSDEAPLELVEIKLAGKPITFGELFEARDNWLQELTIKLRNISDKPITYLDFGGGLIKGVDQEPKMGESYQEGISWEFGERPKKNKPPEQNRLVLHPGVVIELTYADVDSIYRGREPQSGQFSKLQLDAMLIYFEDGSIEANGTVRLSPNQGTGSLPRATSAAAFQNPEEQVWLTDPSSPLQILFSPSRRDVFFLNRSSQRILEYRLGCVRPGDFKVVSELPLVRTNLKPGDGHINSVTLYTAATNRCVSKNAKLAIVKVRFHDNSSWQIHAPSLYSARAQQAADNNAELSRSSTSDSNSVTPFAGASESWPGVKNKEHAPVAATTKPEKTSDPTMKTGSTNGTTMPTKNSAATTNEAVRCQYWQSKVDETVISPYEEEIDETNLQNILEGINCLLQMEANKHPARFSGATQLYVSQIFEPATADVGALYYISYLFTQNWEHADAIALHGADGAVSAPQDIEIAYQSYRRWFEQVKSVGLVQARQMNLQPLTDTKVRWY